jgi:hypothetical protein
MEETPKKRVKLNDLRLFPRPAVVMDDPRSTGPFTNGSFDE